MNALLFLAGAFGLRALFLRQWSRTPYYLFPRLDDQAHHLWALDILHGGLLRGRAFYQSPFYPYFLALLYKAVGVRPAVMLWLQAAAGAFACLVLARVAARMFGRRAGIIAGIIAALYKPFIFFTVFLLKETWIILGLSLFCLAALKAQDLKRVKDAFWCGLALGFTALSRGNVLLMAPVLPLMWLKTSPKNVVRLTGSLVLGMGLMILPATLHNAFASRDFVLINYTPGFTFFLGNNPEATGTTHFPLGISSSPSGEENDSVARAEKEEGRALKPSQVSRHWLRRALQFIRENPSQWLSLTGTKFLLFWTSRELPDNYDPLFLEKHTRTLLSWPLPSFPFVAAFAVAGFFLFFRGVQERLMLAFAGLYMLTVIGTIVSDRYRLPMLVFLIPFAAAFVDRITTCASWKDLKQPAWALFGALPMIAVINAPLAPYSASDEAQGFISLSETYYDRGDYAHALDAFYQAYSIAPKLMGKDGFIYGAAAANKIGDSGAVRMIERAQAEAGF